MTAIKFSLQKAHFSPNARGFLTSLLPSVVTAFKISSSSSAAVKTSKPVKTQDGDIWINDPSPTSQAARSLTFPEHLASASTQKAQHHFSSSAATVTHLSSLETARYLGQV
jgi:Sec7-like guanine-nucleotide exchange factor